MSTTGTRETTVSASTDVPTIGTSREFERYDCRSYRIDRRPPDQSPPQAARTTPRGD